MSKWEIKLVFPNDSHSDKGDRTVGSYTHKFNRSECEDVYRVVEKFKREVFPGLAGKDLIRMNAEEEVSLEELINLHNAGAIKKRSNVGEMLAKIESGREVVMPGGLPNVKVVKIKGGEFVLFDGHHSTLAYMFAGRKYLDQVPHLRLTYSEGRGVKEEECHVFYGEHRKKFPGKDWRSYTLNWSSSSENQLEKREQENMAQLLEALKSDPDFNPEQE